MDPAGSGEVEQRGGRGRERADDGRRDHERTQMRGVEKCRREDGTRDDEKRRVHAGEYRHGARPPAEPEPGRAHEDPRQPDEGERIPGGGDPSSSDVLFSKHPSVCA